MVVSCLPVNQPRSFYTGAVSCFRSRDEPSLCPPTTSSVSPVPCKPVRGGPPPLSASGIAVKKQLSQAAPAPSSLRQSDLTPRSSSPTWDTNLVSFVRRGLHTCAARLVIAVPLEVLGEPSATFNLLADLEVLSGLGHKLILVAESSDNQQQQQQQWAAGLAKLHSAPRLVSGSYVVASAAHEHPAVHGNSMGQVHHLTHERIEAQLASGNIVLLSTTGLSGSNQVLQCSFHDVALHAATQLGADRLIFLHASDWQGQGQAGAPGLSRELPLAQAVDLMLTRLQAHLTKDQIQAIRDMVEPPGSSFCTWAASRLWHQEQAQRSLPPPSHAAACANSFSSRGSWGGSSRGSSGGSRLEDRVRYSSVREAGWGGSSCGHRPGDRVRFPREREVLQRSAVAAFPAAVAAASIDLLIGDDESDGVLVSMDNGDVGYDVEDDDVAVWHEALAAAQAAAMAVCGPGDLPCALYTAIVACCKGVPEALLLDARVEGALLLELQLGAGVGWRIMRAEAEASCLASGDNESGWSM